MDLAIRNASIVDGTGAPPRQADLGIDDGRIVAIEEPGSTALDGATRTIDAEGKVVCPGFVDPHTHYDAQLLWDPSASPSNIHGVTTVVAGNCGFTLAPVIEGDGDYTAAMLAKVEGMPLPALAQGVDWTWTSMEGYLDRLDGKLGVNAAFLVGHCALRRKVMGPDSVGNEATPEQVAEMKRVLAESIEAGAIGFSTTRARTHSDGDGEPVASRWATEDEVLELASVVAEHDGTTLEFASDGCLDGFEDDEVDFMIRFSKTGKRC